LPAFSLCLLLYLTAEPPFQLLPACSLCLLHYLAAEPPLCFRAIDPRLAFAVFADLLMLLFLGWVLAVAAHLFLNCYSQCKIVMSCNNCMFWVFIAVVAIRLPRCGMTWLLCIKG
jgi:hypothetical protein